MSGLAAAVLLAASITATLISSATPDLESRLRTSIATGAPDSTLPARGAGAQGGYVKLPLAFVPNRGQVDARVRYYSRGPGFSAYFTRKGPRLVFADGERGVALDLAFLGANAGARVGARAPRAGVVNHLTGDDPARHHRGLPTYGQVVYRELWPGIDLAFRGSGARLKYELLVRPGASVRDVRLAYKGARGLRMTEAGSLAIQTSLGTVRDTRPRSYQRVGGRRVPVASRFILGRGGGSSYGFEVGSYDRGRPLVIDPGLAYSARLPAALAQGVAVDDEGNAYVSGYAQSGFPTTTGSFDPSFNGGGDDAFVAKLNPTGSDLVYSTFIGGAEGGDRSFDIAVDGSGNAYITGDTVSDDFPTTPGAFDTATARYQTFVTKLNGDGSRLIYSTFLKGGTGFAIEVDDAGQAYVAGNGPAGLQATPGAVDPSPQPNDHFVVKLNESGSGVVYSTFGPSTDYSSIDIAVDAQGSVYLAGEEIFEDVPVTPGAFDTTPPGPFDPDDDAYVLKLAPDASHYEYATYLGGEGHDRGFRIDVDQRGSAYVLGDTESPDFPTTPGVHSRALSGNFDAFVTKFSPSGCCLDYSTYLGGSAYDGGSAMGIAVDRAGRAWAAGRTLSENFPTTPDAHDTTRPGGEDVFVARLSEEGRLTYATYLGGPSSDWPRRVAVDHGGDAYVTGETFGAFPTTPGAFGSTGPGGGGFVSKFDLPAGPPATLALLPETATNVVGSEHCVTATAADGLGEPTPDVAVRFSVTGSVETSGTRTTDANGSATFCYGGPELPGTDAITAYADRDGDETQDIGEPGDTAAKTWSGPSSTPGCTAGGSGRITAANGDSATFRGKARASASGAASGRPRYSDAGPATPLEVVSIAVDALSCGRGRASVFGRATVNGSGLVGYRIDLVDSGSPGRNDTYRILLESGYDSGVQRLERGNLTVR